MLDACAVTSRWSKASLPARVLCLSLPSKWMGSAAALSEPCSGASTWSSHFNQFPSACCLRSCMQAFCVARHLTAFCKHVWCSLQRCIHRFAARQQHHAGTELFHSPLGGQSPFSCQTSMFSAATSSIWHVAGAIDGGNTPAEQITPDHTVRLPCYLQDAISVCPFYSSRYGDCGSCP